VIEIVCRRTIEAPAHRVWDLVEPVERLPQWFSGTEAAVLLGGCSLGRKQRVSGRWGRHRFEIDQTVTRYEPPRVLGWRHDAERLDGRQAPRISRQIEFCIQLEPVGQRTRVELVSRHVPDNVLKGLIIHLIAGPRIRRMLNASLDTMTAILAPSGGGNRAGSRVD
jgi:uncharacterized protein YndB with AHSA1/START domain